MQYPTFVNHVTQNAYMSIINISVQSTVSLNLSSWYSVVKQGNNLFFTYGQTGDLARLSQNAVFAVSALVDVPSFCLAGWWIGSSLRSEPSTIHHASFYLRQTWRQEKRTRSCVEFLTRKQSDLLPPVCSHPTVALLCWGRSFPTAQFALQCTRLCSLS